MIEWYNDKWYNDIMINEKWYNDRMINDIMMYTFVNFIYTNP